MRRLLAGLILLALSAPCLANVAVVTGTSGKFADGDWGLIDAEIGSWCDQQILALLRLYDSDILLVSAKNAKVFELKDGVVLDPATGDTTRVDAVVWSRAIKKKPLLDNGAYERPQALTLADTLPTVPTLLILDQTPGTDMSYTVGRWNDATANGACSTGVGAQVDMLDPGMNAPTEGGGGWVYGKPYHWMWPGRMTCALPMTAIRPAGGLRKLLGLYGTEYNGVAMGDSTAMPTDPLAPVPPIGDVSYNILRFADTDSLIAWERTNSHVTGAARLVFLPMVYAADNNWYRQYNDPLMPFLMLAHLDSLAGRKVFGAAAEPRRIALVIDGAFARAGSGSSYGIAPGDSAALKTSLDSLAAYGIKVTVGAQLDSVAAYPYEKAWWAKLPQVRYAPQVWAGVRDSEVAGLGATNNNALVDIFGHNRKRGAYYGPALGAAKDTSTYALVKYALDRNRATWGERSSSFLIPPMGDWLAPGMRYDSTAIALRLAGASGLLTFGGDTISRGYNVGPGYYHDLKMLPYAATFTAGSEVLTGPKIESADVDTLPGTREVLSGFWNALLFPAAQVMENDGNDRLTGSQHSRPAWPNRGCILYLPAQSLAGAAAGSSVTGQPTGNPLKPGLWTAISVIQQVQAINYLAGRTLIEWVYPEDIRP